MSAHGNTYGGNPIACASALATLDLVEGEYRENAAKMGEYLMDGLRKLAEKYPVIGDVRGKGLMIGMELVKDRQTKEPAKKFANEMLLRGFQNGILLMYCGVSTLRLMPPLMIDKTIADEALTLIDKTFAEVSQLLS